MSPESERDPSIPKAFEVVGEHYQLVRKLGEGAFGVVYEAHHDLLGQNFAVKILKPELCEDENLRERFLDEARALIRFSHENVVQLRHVGEHAGRLYLVMDLVTGRTLSEVIRSEGALQEARAVAFTLQMLHGLESAHAAGIVHRDLKPGNLIVDTKPDGGERVRILDFGLSKLSSVDGMQSAHRSVTGAIIGTLAYMSPEQLSGEKDIDARSDIFAAGLILHEMLDGKHPYPGESGIVVAAKLLREPVPDLDPQKASGVSDSTNAALKTALERDRDARFPSAFTFAEALEGKGPPSDTSRVTTIQEAKAALAAAEAARSEKKKLDAGRPKKGKAVFVAVIAMIAAALGVVFAMQNGDDGGGTDVAHQPSGPGTGPKAPAPKDPGPADPGTTPPKDGPVEEPAAMPAPPPEEPKEEPKEDPGPVVAPPIEPIAPPPEVPTKPVPEPADPAPEAPTDPTPAAVPAPPDVTPAPPGPSLTARDARALEVKGKWMEAAGAWRKVLETEPLSVDALRGTAMNWLRQADAQARRGKVDVALATLDGLIAWLTAQRSEVYMPAFRADRVAARLPLGYLHTHRGEAYTQRARWLTVKGTLNWRAAALKKAEADLNQAWQDLQGDNVPYWEFLLRRAEFHRLSGDATKYLADLEGTTKVKSALVPTHMWVAHVQGLRRAAERVMVQGAKRGPRGPRRNKPRVGPRLRPDPRAVQLAEQARAVLRDGIQWARSNEQPFTREQWLEAARVIAVRDMAGPDSGDSNSLKSRLAWFLEQARAQPRPAWESAEEAEAKLRPFEAQLAILEARVALKARDMDAAKRFSTDALRKAIEGVKLAEHVATQGGELPRALPYVMHAHVLEAQRQAEAARPIWLKAREAGLKNPD